MLPRFSRTELPRRDTGLRLGRRHFFLGSLLALGGAAAGAAIADVYYPLAGLSDDYATRTGERRLYRLPDGSQLLLNARSRADLSYTDKERTLHLREGAVSLIARPDAARAFLIRTSEGTVCPDGPRVMVRQQMRRTLVVAADNAAEITTSAGTRTMLAAGSGTRFDNTLVGNPRADLLADTAWETGWVNVHERPLLEVIQALRPYRRGALRISVAAGGLLANGRYPLDDTDVALRALQADMPIHIRRITPWFTSVDLAPAHARAYAGRRGEVYPPYAASSSAIVRQTLAP
ncbi:FecR domain-containing protein [Bordetella sp. FB-8]|uniref:FecR domain-containing protein n=1 Tax=Bordetella sp. FB-8 TaxID=1159870 RepID=UPI000374FA2B|nr:FecR domain-containing protein [Bordetella sp. FB-8]